MKKTFHVYMLRRILVLNYIFLFLVLLVIAGFLLKVYVKDANLSIIIFLLFLVVDAALGFYLSLSNASKRAEVTIYNGQITISPHGASAEQMPISNIMEYVVTERTIAPKTILELKLNDERKLRFFGSLPWASRTDDFRALCNYITNLSGEKIEQ